MTAEGVVLGVLLLPSTKWPAHICILHFVASPLYGQHTYLSFILWPVHIPGLLLLLFLFISTSNPICPFHDEGVHLSPHFNFVFEKQFTSHSFQVFKTLVFHQYTCFHYFYQCLQSFCMRLYTQPHTGFLSLFISLARTINSACIHPFSPHCLPFTLLLVVRSDYFPSSGRLFFYLTSPHFSIFNKGLAKK